MITPITLEGSSVSLVPLALAHLDRLCAVGLDPRLWQATTIQLSNVGNEQSRRALLRIGATEEGVLRCYRVAPSGAAFDLTVFSIIAAEWPQVRSNLETRLYNRAKFD